MQLILSDVIAVVCMNTLKKCIKKLEEGKLMAQQNKSIFNVIDQRVIWKKKQQNIQHITRIIDM